MLLALGLLSSCSDGDAAAVESSGTVVFDYADAESAPEVRMAVFVRLDSDARRAGAVLVEHEETKLQWLVENPLVIAGASRQWAGHNNLRPAGGRAIPEGRYYVLYSDKAQAESGTMFSLTYPQELCGAALPRAVALVAGSAARRIVLYGADGGMLFCDARKTLWHSAAAIRKDFPAAASFRYYYLSADSAAAVLTPVKSIDLYEENDEY